MNRLNESYRRTILSLSLALLMLGMSAAFALDAGESASLPEEQPPRDNHSPLHEPGAHRKGDGDRQSTPPRTSICF